MSARETKILELLACYPLTQGWTAQQASLTIAAFLDQTSKFSYEALSAACRKLGRAGGPFPPSAGDLCAACDEAQKAVDWQQSGARRLDLSKYRLPPPEKRGYTPDQLADWTLIINGSGPYTLRADADGNELRIPAGYPGAGQAAVYGYLTPGEARAVADARAARKHYPAPRSYHEAAS